MTKTHYKKLYNPNYIGAYAFDPGEEKAVTIKSIALEKVKGTDGKEEECTVMYFIEREKPLIVNKTNAKMMEKIFKSPYIEDWYGKRIVLYVAKVRAFGEMTDAVRIKECTIKNMENAQDCERCGKIITAASNMTPGQVAAYTKKKYGKAVCASCASILKQEAELNEKVDRG